MSKREKIGSICVDSGQMMLVDPCYIKDDFEAEFDDKKISKMQEEGKFDLDYNGACAATLKDNPGSGILGLVGQGDYGLGAVCSTGFGDGVYEVYATVNEEGQWGKRISKLEVIFIDQEEGKGW